MLKQKEIIELLIKYNVDLSQVDRLELVMMDREGNTAFVYAQNEDIATLLQNA